MVEVALIDNGININYIKSNIIKKRIVWEEDSDENYHGTICAAIIRDICNNVQFYDLAVMKKDTGLVDNLISALRWCLTNHIRIINISLGTLDDDDGMKLKNIVMELLSKGCFIIASFHNDNIISYPAIFDGVFGVCHTQDDVLLDGEYYIQPVVPGKDLYIACKNDLYLGEGVYVRTGRSNSFATPVITGHIASILNANPLIERNELIKILQSKQCVNKSTNDIILH